MRPYTIKKIYEWYEAICDALVPALVFSAVVYLIIYFSAYLYH